MCYTTLGADSDMLSTLKTDSAIARPYWNSPEESEEDTDTKEEKKPLTMSENTKDGRTKNRREMSYAETQRAAFQAGAQKQHRH